MLKRPQPKRRQSSDPLRAHQNTRFTPSSLLRFAIVAVCATALSASTAGAGPLGGGADGRGQATVAKKKCKKKKKKRCKKRTAPSLPVTPPTAPSLPVTPPTAPSLPVTPPAAPTPQHTLSVGKTGNGTGTVTSTPAGISCGSICAADFADGTMVTLTPVADAGSTFTSWGGACSGSGACTVSMTETRSLTATFKLDQYTSSLNNGVIKVGIDATNMGGAITYLSEATSPTNLINIYDRGRAVQQSYYAGAAVDRRAEGQFSPTYSPWPWNPITAGDVYRDSATVIASQITSTTMYVMTRPLLWDMPLEQCECVFETWIALEGRRVRVHNKLTTTRTDNRWNVLSRDQELPAVYPIANLPQVVSYTGSQPFTGEPTSDIPEDTTSFWSAWTTLESWGACANASGFGVGVYTPGRTRFIGGLAGSPSGNSRSSSTCYLSPLEVAPLDKTSTYEYDYWLTVGTIDQIRQEVYGLHQSIPPPPTGFPAGDFQVWNFNADGDFGGWTPTSNIASSSVSGGAFNATSTGADPYMHSAGIEKPAADNKVVVRLRNGTPSATAQLFFTTAADSAWSGSKSKRITTLPNSDFTTYTFDMSTVPGWTGTITDLRLDPAEANGTFAIDWIRIGDS
jgi:List-Bact-rpt repeat protein